LSVRVNTLHGGSIKAGRPFDKESNGVGAFVNIIRNPPKRRIPEDMYISLEIGIVWVVISARVVVYDRRAFVTVFIARCRRAEDDSSLKAMSQNLSDVIVIFDFSATTLSQDERVLRGFDGFDELERQD